MHACNVLLFRTTYFLKDSRNACLVGGCSSVLSGGFSGPYEGKGRALALGSETEKNLSQHVLSIARGVIQCGVTSSQEWSAGADPGFQERGGRIREKGYTMKPTVLLYL